MAPEPTSPWVQAPPSRDFGPHVSPVVAQTTARFGVRPLLVAGGIVVVVMIGSLVAGKAHPERPVWPVIVGAVAFFYLWWLAILIFDLVFVWHRYIRHSVALQDLKQLTRPRAGRTPEARTG